MEMTPDRLACLRLVVLSGRMSHDHEALEPFCDDGSTLSKPDVFNQCHDAGWLFSSHDDFMDTSYVHITEAGRLALKESLTAAQRGKP